MKHKFITIDLTDSDLKYIKNLKKKLFSISNDPSFNIFPNLVILGETNLNSLNNKNIKIKCPFIKFENNISNTNSFSYIKSINNDFIESLKSQFKLYTNYPICNKYFKLDLNNIDLPIIHLGNKINNNLKIRNIAISDIRLKIIEIELIDTMIKYKEISSIHLSLDKGN